jgi:N-acetylglucosaminyl-diphospho-decaprenol L-rhamnosyltransferase
MHCPPIRRDASSGTYVISSRERNRLNWRVSQVVRVRGRKPYQVNMSQPADSSVRFSPTAQGADVSVIIVNYNTGRLLDRCIGSLRASAGPLVLQVVIVDNASRDGSAASIPERFPDCTLLANATNVGFGRANNQALALCTAPQVLLLNADAFVQPDTLGRSVDHMNQNPRCGVLGARLVGEDGKGIFSGRSFPSAWQSFFLQTGLLKQLIKSDDARTEPTAHSGARDCDWVVGCYYMVRREVIAQIGLFDPRYFLYFEEVDHCRAVKAAGWKVQCLTDASVVHVGGASAASEGELGVGRQIRALQAESSLLYYRKHGGWSGVLTAATLEVATQLLLSLKSLWRRNLGQASDFVAQAWLTCRLLVRTQAGKRPTR